MAKNTFDIFISYRRTASESAQLIASSLRGAGYDVFLDVESLRSGKFNEQLLGVIDSCKDFLVVLPEGALERCSDPEDWVRREVCRAVEGKKNIIPVILAGFSWPERMPEGMESLKNYQGISASAGAYFDLAMQKLRGYLKSRSHKPRRRWLVALAAILVSLVVLAFAGIRLFELLSLPLYNVVCSTLCQQTSSISLLGDINEDLESAWKRFFSSYSAAPGEHSRQMARTDLLEDLEQADGDIEALRALLDSYTIDLSESRAVALTLRDVDLEAVLFSKENSLLYIDELKDCLDLIRGVVSDGSVSLTENEAVLDNAQSFRHLMNIFYFETLETLSRLPDKALFPYRELVTQWKHFPNGIGLSHTREEYKQYIDTEVNALQEIVSKAHARGLELEQALIDKMDILSGETSKYNALYAKCRRDAQVNPERSVDENWTAIIILATFIDDAVKGAKDEYTANLLVPPQQIVKDLDGILYDFGKAYPALSPAAETARAFYSFKAEGKDLPARLVVGTSGTPKVRAGELVLSINGQPTTPERLMALRETVSSGEVRTIEILRGGERAEAELTEEENALVQFLVLLPPDAD